MSANRSRYRIQPDHAATAEKARQMPGTWLLAGVYAGAESAKAVARHVPGAWNMPAYEPAGAFEAYAARHDDGTAVWVRCVLGLDAVPALPETMAVRVCDRGDGRAYVGVQIVTVTVSALCPRCGGPRGVDTVRPHRFRQDGEWFSVDRWQNSCGHTDTYAAVLRESRDRSMALLTPVRVPRRLVGVVDAGRFREEVRLIHEATEHRTHLFARAAVLLLEETGHQEAAEVLAREVKARSGRMSARQAVEYLTEIGAQAQQEGSA